MSLSEKAKTILYVWGRIGDLIDAGLIGGIKEITPKGIALYDQLKSTGMTVSEVDARLALSVVQDCHPNMVEQDLVRLVCHWRQGDGQL